MPGLPGSPGKPGEKVMVLIIHLSLTIQYPDVVQCYFSRIEFEHGKEIKMLNTPTG